MGDIYFVGCRDCKITRDLDKFYSMRSARSRSEVEEIAGQIKRRKDSFLAALLISFMWEHKGHSCTVFTEHDDVLAKELDPFYGKAKRDKDYFLEEMDNISRSVRSSEC